MTDHPTHHFHGTDEGTLCHDCDARPGRASLPCPAFLDQAKIALAGAAQLLLRALPPSPTIPAPDDGIGAQKAWERAVEDWQTDLAVREAVCRSLARLIGIDVAPEATLPAMSKP